MESNTLFMELSEEQQELVSGGNDITEIVFTNYNLELANFKTAVMSVPGGSSVHQEVNTFDLDTNAFKFLEIDI